MVIKYTGYILRHPRTTEARSCLYTEKNMSEDTKKHRGAIFMCQFQTAVCIAGSI